MPHKQIALPNAVKTNDSSYNNKKYNNSRENRNENKNHNKYLTMSMSTLANHQNKSSAPTQNQREVNGDANSKDTRSNDIGLGFGVGIALVQSQQPKAALRSNRRNEEHIYENLQPAMANKRYLLHKYFRRAALPDVPIYENLCRGCGYGVFEAHGQLCHFCQYIVSGGMMSVDDAQTQTQTQKHKTQTCHEVDDDIYENICGRCRSSYNEKNTCKCSTATSMDEPPPPPLLSSLPLSLLANKTVGGLIVAPTEQTKQPKSKSKLRDKLYKSKSFAKRENLECRIDADQSATPPLPASTPTNGGTLSRNIFYNLFGSLKQINRTSSASPGGTLQRNGRHKTHQKSLEIIHNVDGYENVFRTQETFDLQRICELKRNQTSCSDQHIYGRLKCKDNDDSSKAEVGTSSAELTLVKNCDGYESQRSSSKQQQQQLKLKQARSHDLLLLQEPYASSAASSSLPIEPRVSKGYFKRPRISRIRLLRSVSNVSRKRNAAADLLGEQGGSQRETPDPLEAPTSATSGSQLSLYLNESICHWMTSLRYDIHDYDDDAVAASALEQQPKSVPAVRHLRIYAQQPTQQQQKLLNGKINADNNDNDNNNGDDGDEADEFVNLRRSEKRSSQTEEQILAHIKEKMNEMVLKEEFVGESSMTASLTTSSSSSLSSTSAADVAASPSSALAPAELMVIGFKRNLMRRLGKQEPRQVRKTSAGRECSGNLASTSAAANDQHPQEDDVAAKTTAAEKSAKRHAIYVRYVDDNATITNLDADRQLTTTTTAITTTLTHHQALFDGNMPEQGVVVVEDTKSDKNACATASNLCEQTNEDNEQSSIRQSESSSSSHKVLPYCETQKKTNIRITVDCNNCVQLYADLFPMINNIFLSSALNTNVIYYDKTLSAYLRALQLRAHRERSQVNDWWCKERQESTKELSKRSLLPAKESLNERSTIASNMWLTFSMNFTFYCQQQLQLYQQQQREQKQQQQEKHTGLGAALPLHTTQAKQKSISGNGDDDAVAVVRSLVNNNEDINDCDDADGSDGSDSGVSSSATLVNAHDSVSCMTPLSADSKKVDDDDDESGRQASNCRVDCVATQAQLHVAGVEHFNVNVDRASKQVAKSGCVDCDGVSECVVNVVCDLNETIMNETDTNNKTSENSSELAKTTTTTTATTNQIKHNKRPPQVPQRDPKTTLTTITKTSAHGTANSATKSIIKTKLPSGKKTFDNTKAITTTTTTSASTKPTSNKKAIAMIETSGSKSTTTTTQTATTADKEEQEEQIKNVKTMTVPSNIEVNANASPHTKVTTQQESKREAQVEVNIENEERNNNNNNNNTVNNKNEDDDEDDIYQPIWKFQTVGEAQEDYDVDDAVAECQNDDDDSEDDDDDDEDEDLDADDAAAVAAAVGAVDDVLEGIDDDDVDVNDDDDDIQNGLAGIAATYYETLKAAALAAAGARQKSSLTSSGGADASKRAAMRAAATNAAVIIARDSRPIDDQCDWETDDEFMFATQLEQATERANHKETADVYADAASTSDTLRSTMSNKSSVSSGSASEGSTITNFGSSTATLASIGEENLDKAIHQPSPPPPAELQQQQQHLMSLSRRTSVQGKRLTASAGNVMDAALTEQARKYRNVGIYYSVSDQKVRAIVYDYDRLHASEYFASRVAKLNAKARAQLLRSAPPLPPPPVTIALVAPSTCSLSSADKFELKGELGANDSGIGRQTPSPSRSESDLMEEARAPMPPPRTTSALKKSESDAKANHGAAGSCHKRQLLPDSVQAWKFLLLDVNYVEDEEDLIVSTSEIQRSQQIKEDTEVQQTQQLNILQRFKSASIGNLADLPSEDDKKSIAERMRFRLRGGVFKIHMRSPKSEKKSRGGFFRRPEASSLYLEDGLKAKYPIFGAPLEAMDLNVTTQPNVPCFVIDVVEYIEQPECIVQDGLYRASGNKVSIDELKQKLCESYIYDPRWLRTDDIHTLTSLHKQFFRELGAPLIPQASYERLGPNLVDEAAIETMRIVFDEMSEPNRSTLRYLIKHLTNVAAQSSHNRMPASNLAIVWGPCLLAANQMDFDIGRMNMLAKVLIENFDRIFVAENERLVS